MATTISTTNFNVTTSAFQGTGDAGHYFYSRQHNYLRIVRKSSSTALSATLTIGAYTMTYLLDSNGKCDIDITSAIQLYESNATSLSIDGSTITVAVVYGINPDDIDRLTTINYGECWTNGTRQPVPSTIITSAGGGITPVLPCIILGMSTMTQSGANYSVYDEQLIFNATYWMVMSGSNLMHYQTITPKTTGRTYVGVTCTVLTGHSVSHGVGSRTMAVNMELLSTKMDGNILALQTIGDGYKYISQPTYTITIGLGNLTAFDYLYYAQIMSAENINVTGYGDCEAVTKSYEMPTGGAGRYDLKITLRVKNYVTV